MEANNETVIPLGLISSQWGGTMVEHWQPNATLNAGVCKNSSGGEYAPWQNKRWDIDSGGLKIHKNNLKILKVVHFQASTTAWSSLS